MEVEKEILKLFLDSSNRPKRTPRNESAIQIFLESNFTPSQVKNGLNSLENMGILSSIKVKVKSIGESKFYFSTKLKTDVIFNEIPNKIKRTSKWIGKYANVKVARMIGEHLHYLVKTELRAQGFEIIEEKHVRSYGLRRWNRTKHSLDIIAKHSTKDLVIGVEIKNMLPLIQKSEIMIKLEMCNYLGIVPVFACRWIEPYRKLISEQGFLWQFKHQLYPIGQESFVTELNKRLLLPVKVAGEIPANSIIEFQNWLKNY